MPVAPQPSHGYFYPRSPCGERLTILLITVTTLLFLSTLSLRRATTSGATYLIFLAFLSTLSLRRATGGNVRKVYGVSISIHALLAESDRKPSIQVQHPLNFYPRSPCGERPVLHSFRPLQEHFYPRSPCGERQSSAKSTPEEAYFYPRSPCGERPRPQPPKTRVLYFYPRSPCGERHNTIRKRQIIPIFLSTLSLRRATIHHKTRR